MKWYRWDNYPNNSSRSNPIWVYSRKNNSITLGYYSSGYGYFNMDGDGITCSMWAELIKPEPPKQ